MPRPVAGGYKLPEGFAAVVAENEGGALEISGLALGKGEVTRLRMGEEGGVALETATE